MSTPPDREPTQQELEAYIAELRSLPVQELLMQAISMFIEATQVKLGLVDARVLIDSVDALATVGGAALGEEISSQVREVVSQLKTAQVQAEAQLRARGGETAPAGEDQAETAPPPPRAPEPPADGRATDRLWIPGR